MHRTSSHACVSVSRRCMTKKTGSLRLVKCAWPLRRVVFLSPTKCAYDGYSPRLPHEMYMPNTTGMSPAISRNVHVQYDGYGPLSPRPCYGRFCACCNLESFWDAMWGFWDALCGSSYGRLLCVVLVFAEIVFCRRSATEGHKGRPPYDDSRAIRALTPQRGRRAIASRAAGCHATYG